VYFDHGFPTYLKFGINMSREKDFFYLSIDSSKTLNYPNNTPSRFHIELMKEYF